MRARDVMKTEFLTIDVHDSVAKLLGRLQTYKQRAAVVLQDGKYRGVTYSRQLLRSKAQPATWKVKRCCLRPATLDGSESITELVRLFYVSDSPVLPVIQRDVVGVVLVEDVLRNLMPVFAGKQARDFMQDCASLKETARTGKAIEMMFEEHMDMIPVVDRLGTLIGMVGEQDVLGLLGQSASGSHNGLDKPVGFDPNKYDAAATPIGNFVQRAVPLVYADTALAEVITTMVNERILTLPVVDMSRKVLGVITSRHILKQYYINKRKGYREGI